MKYFLIRTEERWFDHQAGAYRGWVPGRLYIIQANTTTEARKKAEINLTTNKNMKRIRCIEETAGIIE